MWLTKQYSRWIEIVHKSNVSLSLWVWCCYCLALKLTALFVYKCYQRAHAQSYNSQNSTFSQIEVMNLWDFSRDMKLILLKEWIKWIHISSSFICDVYVRNLLISLLIDATLMYQTVMRDVSNNMTNTIKGIDTLFCFRHKDDTESWHKDDSIQTNIRRRCCRSAFGKCAAHEWLWVTQIVITLLHSQIEYGD